MKKSIVLSGISLSFAVGLMLFGTSSVSASGKVGEVSNRKMSIEEYKKTQFTGMKDSDKILPLSDGGFLYGEMETFDEVTGKRTVQNSETDPNSITVDEAKIIDEKNFRNSFTLNEFVTPRYPSPSRKLYVLKPLASYLSNPFSGSGWQFAGYLFGTTTAGKTTIRWTSIGDSGKAGDKTDAYNTYLTGGNAYGIYLNQGVPKDVYPTDGGPDLTYYSWNPAPGSRYRAQNPYSY